jgi:penicillin-binding protein 1B
VSLEDVPEHLVRAVVTTEDQRFFEHTGLDPIGILRAALEDLRAQEARQGGSTLTQQLVKNYFLTPEKTIRRKLLEAFLAIILESQADKEEILELYLNDVYLGQRGSFSIDGVGPAARIFFGKDVRNLELEESALLAALIRSPNRSSPFRHPDRARERRNIVLKQMADQGFITADRAKSASNRPVQVVRSSVDTGEAPYFIDVLRRKLLSRYSPRSLQRDNLSVFSTLDASLQGAAQVAVTEGLEEIEKKLGAKTPKGDIQAALIALNPVNGDVLALVGGRSYGVSQFNRAVDARRQPGSAFKPFVYLAAFEQTYERTRETKNPSPEDVFTPATRIRDEPTTFRYGNRTWSPKNYDRKFEGTVTLRQALARSLNVATAKLGERVGFERVVSLWESLGMSSRLEPYPSLVLGTFEVTPLELAAAYAVVANGGTRVDPRFFTTIRDAQGRTLDTPRAERHVVAHAESTFLVTELMRSVINEGTGWEIRARGFKAPAAGKTGTTDDTRDAWFVGFVPDLLAVVWVGYDDNRRLGLTGSQAALPIWTRFMKAAVSGRAKSGFDPPSGITYARIDPLTGKLATAACPSPRQEVFITGTEPRQLCTEHR